MVVVLLINHISSSVVSWQLHFFVFEGAFPLLEPESRFKSRVDFSVAAALFNGPGTFCGTQGLSLFNAYQINCVFGSYGHNLDMKIDLLLYKIL